MIADNLQRPAMNLQLFGEEPESTEAPVEQPVEPEPQQAQETEEPTYDSLQDFLQTYQSEEEVPTESTGEEPVQEEAPVEQKTVEEQKILGKFDTQEDLIEAYQQAEKRISEYGQDGARARQELEQLRGQVSQLQQFLYQQRQPQQPQPTAEEIEAKKQEWLDRFYENPQQALDEEINRRVRQHVEPIQRERQIEQSTKRFQQQVEEAKQRYPDFDDLQPQMQEIINEQGQYLAALPNAVEVVYGMAKARNPQQQTSQPQNTEDILQNNEVRQRILQDPSIKQEILKQYAQEVKQKQPPPVLGDQHGEPVASPPEEIKSTKDAKKATMNFFQRMAGGGSK